MSDRLAYIPGPPQGARLEQNGEKWTLILVRELRHSPEKVWQALIDPAQLREWAPFDVDGSLDRAGTTVKVTWMGARPVPIDTQVTLADAPKTLEFGNIRWELEPLNGGTRLTLWLDLDRRYASMGAAGWHIAFDSLYHLLNGTPIGRIAGPDAMKFEGWQRLNGEYAKLFGIEMPSWPTQAAQKGANS